MKLRILSLAMAMLLATLLIASPAYATGEPSATPTISDVKTNTYLIESGDLLIYGKYNIPYTTLPDDDASKTYSIRLFATDGTTQLGVVLPHSDAAFDNGYNEGVFGFYFGAGHGLVSGTQYIIRISQSPAYFTTPQSWTYEMPASAWTSKTTQDDNQTELAISIIALAQDLEIAYATTLLEDSASGTVLNSPTGETYFRGAIYGIQAMAPDLFLVQILEWATTDRDWDTTGDNSTMSQMDTYESRLSGTWLDTATDNVSASFGMDTGTMMTFIFTLPIFIGAAILSSIKWRRVDPALFIGALLLMCTVLIGWVPPALFAVIYQLFAFYIGYLIFFARAGDSLGGKYLMFIAFVWLCSALICLVAEGAWIGATENTIINDLTAIATMKVGGVVPIASSGVYFFRGLFRIFLWDFSFYTGNFEFLRYLMLIVFTGSAVYCIWRDAAPVAANLLRIK